jgi:tetratricopeptide (TPR) repeat protein
MAQEDANQDLQFEINSRLSEIANSLLDSVLNNFNTLGYEKSENLVQRAIEISPKTRFRGDKVLAQMYFEQGNILFRIGNFEKALEKFSFAQRLDPDMGNLLNVKRKDLALGFISDASKATDVESIYLVIESLKSAIKMEPDLEEEMMMIVKELENRLEEMDKREVQKIIDDLVNIERRPNQNSNKKNLELGLLPHEVKSILGEPDFIDTITDIDGIRYDMWSYTKLNVTKRLYFEDLFLVRMEEE